MSEFSPYGLFYDALSGEFTPPSDPLHRQHTLARLAVAAVEKGRGPDDARDYVPSWALGTYAIVERSDDEETNFSQTSLTIAGSSGRWPQIYRFEDYRLNPTNGPRDVHKLVISDAHGGEIIHPLILGPRLEKIKHEIAVIAEGFYKDYPNYFEEKSDTELRALYHLA